MAGAGTMWRAQYLGTVPGSGPRASIFIVWVLPASSYMRMTEGWLVAVRTRERLAPRV